MYPTAPKVLCPVDFSDASRRALRYAVAIADHFKAKLCVLNVSSGADAGAQQSLARFVDVELNGTTLYPRPWIGVRGGSAPDVILDVARKEKADLIVMSVLGAAARRQHCGSTTLHVLRYSRIPLLLVPPAVTKRPVAEVEHLLGDGRIVLAPVDFEPRALLDAAVAAAIAGAFGVPIVLFHALPPRESGRIDDARRILDEFKRTFRTRTEARAEVAIGEIGPEIARFASSERAGLIVMGLRGSAARTGELPGSIAFDVLGRAPVLVLGIPEPVGYERSAVAGSEPGKDKSLARGA